MNLKCFPQVEKMMNIVDGHLQNHLFEPNIIGQCGRNQRCIQGIYFDVNMFNNKLYFHPTLLIYPMSSNCYGFTQLLIYFCLFINISKCNN